MASVSCTASSVTIGKSGSLSGSATITGTNNGRSSQLAVIPASGSPTKGGGAFDAGSNNGWTLDVTYGSDGTATGTAGGNYSGSGWDVAVGVSVDHPGKSRHRKAPKGRTRKTALKPKRTTARGKAKPKARKTARRTKTVGRRTKASTRKARSTSRRKTARRR